MQLNISPPDFSSTTDNYNAEKIKGYLSALQNQLSHMLLNIEEENLSDNLLNTIKNFAKTAEKINWLISDKTSRDSISLSDSAISLILNSLKLVGIISLLPTDENGNIDLSSNKSGMIIGKNITLSSEKGGKHIYVNDAGNMVFDTAKNALPFSLALNKTDSGYSLSVLDESADSIGKIDL